MEKIIDTLYSKFLMRDIFGKIIPGLVFLISIILLNSEFLPDIELEEINFGIWIILLCFSWLVGMAIQGVGEIIGLISYYPKDKISDDYKSNNYFEGTIKIQNARFIEFSKYANDEAKQRRERFTVIKEASGNMYTSFVLSAIFVILNEFNDRVIFDDKYITLIVAFLIITIGFRFMHKAHVIRQYEYTKQIIEEHTDN